MITPGLSETYFNHTFNVLSTLFNLKYNDVEHSRSLELTSIGAHFYPSRLPRTSWPIRSPSQHPHRRLNTTTLHTYILTPL